MGLLMTEWEEHMQRHHLSSLTALAAAAGVSAMLLTDTAQARPYLPPAGECRSMVAATAGKGIWFGQFSGRYQNPLSDRIYPLAARGCFASEYACRRWTNEVLSIGRGPGLMNCRPYNEVR